MKSHSVIYVQRLDRLAANQNRIFRTHMSTIITHAVELVQAGYCPQHFYFAFRSYLETQRDSPFSTTTSRSTFEIALISLNMMYSVQNASNVIFLGEAGLQSSRVAKDRVGSGNQGYITPPSPYYTT